MRISQYSGGTTPMKISSTSTVIGARAGVGIRNSQSVPVSLCSTMELDKACGFSRLSQIMPELPRLSRKRPVQRLLRLFVNYSVSISRHALASGFPGNRGLAPLRLIELPENLAAHFALEASRLHFLLELTTSSFHNVERTTFLEFEIRPKLFFSRHSSAR